MADFAEREGLHQRLAKMPLAGPSLRFAQGGMDKLPWLPSPFIPQRQLRAFGRAATVTIALYFLALALLGNRPVEGGGDGGWLTRLTDRFWASLPSADLDVVAALSLGFFADRYLAKRARTSG